MYLLNNSDILGVKMTREISQLKVFEDWKKYGMLIAYSKGGMR